MSAIFISHSSRDNEFCKKLIKWLDKQGHRSVFLDFDEKSGIAGGQDWEQKLYRELRVCSAMIVVCSKDSMDSKWCFAEITHARSLGKQIFPIQVAPCEINSILSKNQVIDFINLDEKVAFERLKQGFIKAGIDTKDPYAWDGSRPPYPGLLAFQEEDAAIFFGREKEIREGLDVLTSTHRYRSSGLIMILGASGSGKSSLVRAGIIPRLKRDPERWLVLNPIQPGEDPFRELAKALKKAFQKFTKEEHSIDELYNQLQSASKLAKKSSNDFDSIPQLKNYDVFEKLHEGADRANASILFTIDQFEELLDRPKDHLGSQFLVYLSFLLQKKESKLIVLGTMRSDFLGMFQQNKALQDLEFGKILVGPINTESLTEIIEKPAELAGLRIEPKLVQALIEDTRTNDALPLLAFTLRELYDNYSDDNLLEFREYEELGGTEGSVAKSAEGALSKPKLTTTQEELLRKAFLQMTRVNEQGNFTRNRVAWNNISPEIHEVLNRLVDGRLLVSNTDGEGNRTLEVAHESLFRSWKRLKAWLDEDREFLLWRNRLSNALLEWENNKDKSILLSGVKLQEASSWSKSHQEQLNSHERLFIGESVKEDIRQKRIKQKRNAVLITIAISFMISIFILFINAEKEKIKAQANYLISEANRIVETDQTIALHLAAAAHSLQPKDSLISKDAYRIYDQFMFYKTMIKTSSQIRHSEISPNSEIIGASFYDSTVNFWNLNGELIGDAFLFRGEPSRFKFFPDSKKVIILDDSRKNARVHDLNGENLSETMDLSDIVRDISFSLNQDTISFYFYNNYVSQWTADGNFIEEYLDVSKFNDQIIFTRGGQFEIQFSEDQKSIFFFDNEGGKKIWPIFEFPIEIKKWEYSEEHELLLITTEDNISSLWNLNGQQVGGIIKIPNQFNPYSSPTFARSGKYIIFHDLRTIWLWSLNKNSNNEVLVENSFFNNSSSLSPDGKSILITSDETVRIVDFAGNNLYKPMEHENAVFEAIYFPDGKTILTITEDGKLMRWDSEGNSTGIPFLISGNLQFLLFSSDGKILLTGTDEEIIPWSLDGDPKGIPISDDYLISIKLSNEETIIVSLENDKDVFFNVIDNPKNISSNHINFDLKSLVLFGLEDFDFSTNGLIVLAGDQQFFITDYSALSNLNLEDEEVITRFLNGPLTSLKFSPDGFHILSASEDGIAQLWDLNGSRIGNTMEHKYSVEFANFSSEGSRILTVSNGSAKIWDQNGNPMKTLVVDPKGIEFAAISKDGNFVISSNYDNEVLISKIIYLSDFIKSDQIADLTKEQKDQYGIEEPSLISKLILKIFPN